MGLGLVCALIPCHNRITRPWTLQRIGKSDRVQSPTLILIRKRNEELFPGRLTLVLPAWARDSFGQNDQGRRNYNRLEVLLFATRVGHRSNLIAADKVADKLHVEEGYSGLGECIERGTSAVHTVVDSHYALVVDLVNAAETEHTERAADIVPVGCKVQAGGNLEIADNAEIVDGIVKGRGNEGAA